MSGILRGGCGLAAIGGDPRRRLGAVRRWLQRTSKRLGARRLPAYPDSPVLLADSALKAEKDTLLSYAGSVIFRKPSRVRLGEWAINGGIEEMEQLAARSGLKLDVESYGMYGMDRVHPEGPEVTWTAGVTDEDSDTLQGRSYYVLAPAGDVWTSGRMIEALTFGAIPVVEDRATLAPLWNIDPHAIAVSVQEGEGLPDLFAAIQNHLAAVENRVELLLPHTAGALHAEIRAKATVLSEFYTEDGCLMEIQASPAVLGRLMANGAVPVQRPDPPA